MFAYSTDEERFYGKFDTIEGAVAAALENDCERFYVGKMEPPIQPEAHWDADDWLEHVSCQDQYDGDWADHWDGSTPAQREELEAEVRQVLAAWLDRHNLRPEFTLAADVTAYVVRDGVAVPVPKKGTP